MANESFGRHIPFVFLKDIQAKLLEKYTAAQILNTPPYGIQSSFSKTIQQQMEYYNNSDGDNKLKRVQHEIDQVKDVMSHNIDRVLERGDRIDILVDKTHGLSQQAFAFKKRSTLLKVKYQAIYVYVSTYSMYYRDQCGGKIQRLYL